MEFISKTLGNLGPFNIYLHQLPHLQKRKNYYTVLVLSGIVLIVFPVARMRLYFGFLMKTMLFTQGCFS